VIAACTIFLIIYWLSKWWDLTWKKLPTYPFLLTSTAGLHFISALLILCMQWLVWYWDLGTNIYDNRGNGWTTKWNYNILCAQFILFLLPLFLIQIIFEVQILSTVFLESFGLNTVVILRPKIPYWLTGNWW